MTKTGKIELMAPAGDFTSLQAALDNGADSVYFGVEQLNMRARASMNFTLDDLPEISRRCKEKGVRTYLTLNTIIYNHDLSIIKTLLDRAKAADLTAVIAMDQAVIAYARQIGMEVHISTQINITNIETVKFYALFADTMVMSRELSVTQVKKICQQIEKEQIKGPSGNLVEIEIFGHGALCMAVSGKCYLSLHSHNSSANRGACKQNCRKKYTVIDQESGFEITDRIRIVVEQLPVAEKAIADFSEFIAGQVLAESITLAANVESETEFDLDGTNVKFLINKI